MTTAILPTTISQIMPTLQGLDVEQKLLIIKELLSDKMPTVAESETNVPPLQHDTNLAWEAGKNIFGSYASGRNDLSTNAKTLVKEKIRKKYGKNSD